MSGSRHSKNPFPSIPQSFPYQFIAPADNSHNLQFIMLGTIPAIGIRHSGLHRLRGPTNRTLDLRAHALIGLTLGLLASTLGLLRSRRRLLTHLVRIRPLGILGVVRDISVHLVLAVLFDEVRKVLDGAGAAVCDRGGLGTGGEELDGWEACDLVRDVVQGSVDFGDGDLFGVGWIVEVESG